MGVESGDACFQELKGSSSVAIGKYVKAKKPMPAGLLARELKKMVTAGTLVQVTSALHLDPLLQCSDAHPIFRFNSHILHATAWSGSGN